MLPIGVIGAGVWGKNLIRVFSQLPQVELRYIADLHEPIRKLNQNLYPKTTVVEDYTIILEDPKVQGIVVATPTETHFSIIQKVLNSGKHCFAEKPLTLSSQESLQLMQQAQQQQKVLMVGHLLKYHPAVRYIKKILDRKELGEILYIYSNRLNLGQVRTTENCWWSLAPHDLSLILYFLDEKPNAISATGSCFLQRDIEDVVFATLFYGDHKMAHLHVSWLDPHKVRTLTIVGSKKMLMFNDMEPSEKIRIYDKGATISDDFTPFAWFGGIRSGDIYSPHLSQEEPLKEECSHFVDCIVKGIPCLSDAYEGSLVVELLERGQESLRQRGQLIPLTFPSFQ
ncbi:MAG: Gfo/Idh/MocA family oxidoreductase [Planctomycetota bacterium]